MRETPRLHFNSQPLSMFAVQFLNGIGDLLDLIPVLKRRSNSSSDSFRMPGMSHCSALIKVRGKMMPSPHDCNHIFWIGTKCNRNLPLKTPCQGFSIALIWIFGTACVGNGFVSVANNLLSLVFAHFICRCYLAMRICCLVTPAGTPMLQAWESTSTGTWKINIMAQADCPLAATLVFIGRCFSFIIETNNNLVL